jgi:DNA-binding response OmpR family regulator
MKPDEHPRAILLVDDDDSLRKLLSSSLKNAGYAVIAASDGDLGLAFFKQNRQEIALVLADVAMPNMNGLDMADRILELDAKMPVILMSGTVHADRGYGFLAKPFRAPDLLAKVDAVLRRQDLVEPPSQRDYLPLS